MEKEDQEFWQTFPPEIVDEILLRLPVKSILQFKSVCKAWRSLMSSPKFVKDQVDLVNSPAGNLRAWRCLYVNGRGLECIDRDANARNREVIVGDSTMISSNFYNYKILGSCNGLLLLMNGKEKLLCLNPSTGKYHHLLPELPTMTFSPRENHTIYGLGYDSSSNDYKVVFVTRKQLIYDIIGIFVYSFRMNTWKQVEHNDFPYTFYFHKQGTIVNGAPHWVVLFKEKLNAKVICYFDPAEEKFSELSLPCFLESNMHSGVELDVFGGCLSLTRNIGGGSFHQFETWVMRENSWTKLFVIPTTTLNYMRLRPLCFTTNTEVLMEVDRMRLAVYNRKHETEIHVSSLGIQDTYNLGFELGTYVESLVFPVMGME